VIFAARVRALATAALAVSLLASPVAARAAVPANDGWVTDLAGMLSPDEERSLETLMESYKAGSGHEIALLTVPDLGGQALERYALEVARTWGIGSKETQAGALLLIAKRERKIRIEVGRGLEGALTDSISGRIIRNVISPAFREGRLYDGIRGGVEAMHAAAGGDYGAIPEGRRDTKKRGIGALLPLLWFLFMFVMILRGRRRRGGSVLPWLILGSMGGRRSSGWHGGGGGGGFSGFGGGGGFSGGGASGGW
jgi:uncharacterized protein